MCFLRGQSLFDFFRRGPDATSASVPVPRPPKPEPTAAAVAAAAQASAQLRQARLGVAMQILSDGPVASSLMSVGPWVSRGHVSQQWALEAMLLVSLWHNRTGASWPRVAQLPSPISPEPLLPSSVTASDSPGFGAVPNFLALSSVAVPPSSSLPELSLLSRLPSVDCFGDLGVFPFASYELAVSATDPRLAAHRVVVEAGPGPDTKRRKTAGRGPAAIAPAGVPLTITDVHAVSRCLRSLRHHWSAHGTSTDLAQPVAVAGASPWLDVLLAIPAAVDGTTTGVEACPPLVAATLTPWCLDVVLLLTQQVVAVPDHVVPYHHRLLVAHVVPMLWRQGPVLTACQVATLVRTCCVLCLESDVDAYHAVCLHVCIPVCVGRVCFGFAPALGCVVASIRRAHVSLGLGGHLRMGGCRRVAAANGRPVPYPTSARQPHCCRVDP